MYIGIDIGGTSIKFGVVDEEGNILKKDNIPTEKDTDSIIKGIVDICRNMINEYDITHIGAASPGIVKDGIIEAPGNLPFRNTPLAQILQTELGLPVFLGNDAQCAALAEAMVGAGKGGKDMVMLTLGTGIGGAIVIDGKVYKGNNGGAGELGHSIFERNGLPCPCGRRGCFEQYASITALINQTRLAAKENHDSVLAQICNEENAVNGQTVFKAMDKGCAVAAEVYDQYISYLAEGIDSFIMILQPEIVVLGGSISREGERLTKPIQDKLNSGVKVKTASLSSNAGIIGASLLCKQN